MLLSGTRFKSRESPACAGICMTGGKESSQLGWRAEPALFCTKTWPRFPPKSVFSGPALISRCDRAAEDTLSLAASCGQAEPVTGSVGGAGSEWTPTSFQHGFSSWARWVLPRGCQAFLNSPNGWSGLGALGGGCGVCYHRAALLHTRGRTEKKNTPLPLEA